MCKKGVYKKFQSEGLKMKTCAAGKSFWQIFKNVSKEGNYKNVIKSAPQAIL